jgi:site-specific DNA-methyltransferase (adenine-specific)
MQPRSEVPEGIFLSDALDSLTRLPDECIDLVYLDPPFGTGRNRRLDSIRTGSGPMTRTGFAGRTYSYEVTSSIQYADRMTLEEYIGFLHVRIVQVHRVLKTTGSLYLHLDHNAVHHARLLLDEVFGAERFVNEIIWAYDYGGRARDRWPRKHDNILWYSKSRRWTFNRDAVDRIPYMAPGLVGPDKAARGKLPTDVWWLTIVPTNGAERTGYPTQKPEKLLERIITASSNQGDLVADFFCGSGTTGAVAARLGRRYLLVDDNPDAVRIASQRLREVRGFDAVTQARSEPRRNGA